MIMSSDVRFKNPRPLCFSKPKQSLMKTSEQPFGFKVAFSILQTVDLSMDYFQTVVEDCLRFVFITAGKYDN